MADPTTYEEAIQQGYRPVEDADIIDSLHKGDVNALSPTTGNTHQIINCQTQPVNTVCRDVIRDGYRFLCFCTAAKECKCTSRRVD